MTSFRISVSPQRRVAARFVDAVRRKLSAAYAERPDVTQSAIADALGVHRSVINRQLRGQKDMSLARVAEISWCLGLEPVFDLRMRERAHGDNTREATLFSTVVKSTQQVADLAKSENKSIPATRPLESAQ